MKVKGVFNGFSPYFVLNLFKTTYVVFGIILNFHYVSGRKEQSGHPAVWRDNVDSVKRAILVTDPTRPITSSGLVTEWHVFIHKKRRNQELHLQVWRPLGKRIRSSDEYTAMELIGFTKIVSIWPGYNRFFLYPEDRIAVQQGDLIALYFPGFNPVPWTEVECRPGRAHMFLYNPRGVEVGTELLFSTATLDWRPCRAYSYNCTVLSEQAAENMDKRIRASGDLPYGKRPYGKYIPDKLPDIVIPNDAGYANNINQCVFVVTILLSLYMC